MVTQTAHHPNVILNRESNKNHYKNNLTENFSKNSYSKTIKFQLFTTFKNKIEIEGVLFRHSGNPENVKPWKN